MKPFFIRSLKIFDGQLRKSIFTVCYKEQFVVGIVNLEIDGLVLLALIKVKKVAVFVKL